MYTFEVVIRISALVAASHPSAISAPRPTASVDTTHCEVLDRKALARSTSRSMPTSDQTVVQLYSPADCICSNSIRTLFEQRGRSYAISEQFISLSSQSAGFAKSHSSLCCLPGFADIVPSLHCPVLASQVRPPRQYPVTPVVTNVYVAVASRSAAVLLNPYDPVPLWALALIWFQCCHRFVL